MIAAGPRSVEAFGGDQRTAHVKHTRTHTNKKREARKKEGEKKKSRGLKLLSRVMEVSVKGE